MNFQVPQSYRETNQTPNKIRAITASQIHTVIAILVVFSTLVLHGCTSVPTQNQSRNIQGGWRIVGSLDGKKSQVWFARAIVLKRAAQTMGGGGWTATVPAVRLGPLGASDAAAVTPPWMQHSWPNPDDVLSFVSLDQQTVELKAYKLQPIPDELRFLEAIKNDAICTGVDVFYGCWDLDSVTIPADVTKFSADMFTSWTNLAAINVAPGNTIYSSADGVLFNKNLTTLIRFPWNKTGEYRIPSGVDSIQSCAFWACKGLKSVTIPNSVTDIQSLAFYGCTGLKSVTLPSSITNIAHQAFMDCTGLTSVTIPNGVREIKGQAFVNCEGLTTVTIPSSVTNIGYAAFHGCTKLARVNFEGNAPSIGEKAFGKTSATIYYVPGTTGWDKIAGARPAPVTSPSSVPAN